MPEQKHHEILEFIKNNPSLSSKEIHDGLVSSMGYATVKRILKILISEKLIITEGSGRGTKYKTGPVHDLFYPIDVDDYFSHEIDERIIRENFNFSLISNLLREMDLFKEYEIHNLTTLQTRFTEKKLKLSKSAYAKELERLSIDLSWKSSQIEGNTYSLLETERLLKEKETAAGKTKDEAIMLLNHKEAIDFIINDPVYLFPLDISKIEKLHTILINGLGIESGIRTTMVGITGTNYKPLEYEQLIRKALREMCALVNQYPSVFEKAFLLLVLISYIQPFADGNKRAARILSNAALINQGHCPISFRTVDTLDFKKAMLLFYEQNNLTAIKKIFIDQYEFAVNTYF